MKAVFLILLLHINSTVLHLLSSSTAVLAIRAFGPWSVAVARDVRRDAARRGAQCVPHPIRSRAATARQGGLQLDDRRPRACVRASCDTVTDRRDGWCWCAERHRRREGGARSGDRARHQQSRQASSNLPFSLSGSPPSATAGPPPLARRQQTPCAADRPVTGAR
jgi:hypothetical protein